MFIDPNATIEEGEMFAIEIYIGERKSNGTMIKSTTIPVTHYQVNDEITKDILEKLKPNEKEVFEKIKLETRGLAYEYTTHSNYNTLIINKLIKENYIIKHEAHEFKSSSKEKIKYIQYEDCFIIKDNQLYNLSG